MLFTSSVIVYETTSRKGGIVEFVVAIILLVAIVQTVILRWALNKWAARWAHVAPQPPASWHFVLFLALNACNVISMSRVGQVVSGMLLALIGAFFIFAAFYYYDVWYIRKNGFSIWRGW